METTFLAAAGLGGAVIICQFLVGLFGLGGDHDVGDHGGGDHGGDADHGDHWYVGFLTLRTLAAALTFFGLGGMTALSFGLEPPAAVAAAVGAGALALYAVAALMKAMGRLRSDGTARIEAAVGKTGTVYLRVPAAQAGPGKIHLNLQNRTVEYSALTRGGELPTGAAIRVVGVIAAGAVEVEAA